MSPAIGGALTTFATASRYAREVDRLTWALGIFCAVLTVGIFTLIVLFCVRYRRGSAASREAAPAGNVRLEIGWTAALVVISCAIFAWSGAVYMSQQRDRPGALRIAVIGRQWMWAFEHPGGQRELGELHVPAGTPVELSLISEDVIHSFFVPALRVKQDALPGRYTTLRFEADRPGVLRLLCAEYCGLDHAVMGGRVVVMEKAAYQEWLASGAGSEPLIAQGAASFRTLGCAGCHRADGRGIGPGLAGVAGRSVPLTGGGTVEADRSYLRTSVVQPGRDLVAGYPDVMPSFQGELSESTLLHLVAYLESLGGAEAPVAEARP